MSNNDESKVEKILNELVDELNIDDIAKKEAFKKIQEVVTAYKNGEQAQEAPVEAPEKVESTDLVSIKKAELQKISGCTSDLLARYLEEGIKPFEIIEMYQVARKYDTKITHIKNRILDEGVNVDDIDAILEARDCLDFSNNIDIRTSSPYKPTVKALISIYHAVNDDVEEFKQIIKAADEYQDLAVNRYARLKTERINPNKFLKRILGVYLNEGKKDMLLTMDILEAKIKKNHKEEEEDEADLPDPEINYD